MSFVEMLKQKDERYSTLLEQLLIATQLSRDITNKLAVANDEVNDGLRKIIVLTEGLLTVRQMLLCNSATSATLAVIETALGVLR